VFSRLSEAHRALTDVSVRFSVDEIVGPEAVAANDSVRPPPAPRVTLRDIDAALARNDLAAAEAAARTLTSTGAAGPDARAVLAWCTLGAGAITEPQALATALAALDKVLTGDPDCVRALFYRGQVLKRLGRVELAIRDYRKAVRLDPRHVDAQREMRIHEMRLRAGSSGHMNAVAAPKKTPSREMAAHLTPADSEAVDATSAPARAEDSSVRSGLRRLLARVAGK
jgi:tetratricopeptide (TPR) repeat protein